MLYLSIIIILFSTKLPIPHNPFSDASISSIASILGSQILRRHQAHQAPSYRKKRPGTAPPVPCASPDPSARTPSSGAASWHGGATKPRGWRSWVPWFTSLIPMNQLIQVGKVAGYLSMVNDYTLNVLVCVCDDENMKQNK